MAFPGHRFLFDASFLRGFGRVLIKKMSGFHDFIDKLPAAFTQRCSQWKLATFFSSLALVLEDAEKKAPTALRAVNVNVAVWLGPICAI